MKAKDPFIAVNPIRVTPHGLLVVGHQGTKLIRESEFRKLVHSGGVKRKHAAPIRLRTQSNPESRQSSLS